MIRYDKMYYIVFNAITDALEVMEALPQCPEREQLRKILCTAQQNSEQVYVMSERAETVKLFPKCSRF